MQPLLSISVILPCSTPHGRSTAVSPQSGRRITRANSWRSVIADAGSTDGVLDAGAHSLVWDGRNTTGKMSASGAYFYVIKAGGSIAKGKVMFLR